MATNTKNIIEHPSEHSQNCFICWRGTQDALKLTPVVPLKSPHLTSNLTVIFLVRKVLGLPQHVLINLLGKNYGGDNPTNWGIKLCISCNTIFKEAHFLYRRLIKIQADFQQVAKELRDILVASQVTKQKEETASTSSPPLKKRRLPGRRPFSKKVTGNFLEAFKLEEMEEDPVNFLRTKFIQCNKSNTLEISPPKLIFTTGSELPSINGLQTSLPLHLTVKVTTEDFLRANGLPSVSIPPLKTSVTPTKVPEVPSTSTLLIKQEHLQINEEEPSDNPSDNFDHHTSLIPPPPPDDEPEWAPDDNDDDNLHQDNPSEDSDFIPSPTKKRDKRFTRKKPNLKENQRRKDLRTVKALSLSKAPTGAPLEPLKITEEQELTTHTTYKCPQPHCDLKFPKKFHCHIHHLKDHLDDPLPYHCHVCPGKRFLQETYFRKHMSRYHLSALHPYDSDYDPSLHSPSHLKTLISQDNLSLTQDSSSSENEDESKIPGIPQIPPDILEKFTSNSEGSPFLCSHCSRKFSNEMLRDAHEKRVHLNIPKPFCCTLCPLSFLRRTRLLSHLAIAHYSNQLSCPQCSARFADKVLLRGHIGRAHLGEKNPFKCPHCPSRFLRRTKMDLHMFKKHSIPLPKGPPKRKIPTRCIPLPKLHPSKAKKGSLGPSGVIEPPPPKKCWICHSSTADKSPLLFDTVEDLKDHNDLHHKPSEDNPKPFKCPVKDCPREYRTHATLDFHVMNIHDGQLSNNLNSGPFKCSRCEETFLRGNLLDEHMAREHQMGMFICNYCAKQFRTPKYLEDHQRQMHFKEMGIDPPFKCKYCGRIMNTAKNLDHHIKSVHLRDTPFKCRSPGCSFHAMYSSSLKMHLQIKHSNKKNAICPVCSRTFAAEWYLNRHMLVHTGEKPYKCGECGKMFSDYSTFSRHKEAHLGRVHKCIVEGCEREYKTRHAWRGHLKEHRRKGVDVEIPGVRYQTEEEDERGRRLLEEERRGKEGGEEGTKVEGLPVLEEMETGKVERDGRDLEGLPVLENEELTVL